MQTLSLTTAEKASLHVAVRNSDGTTSELGADFHFGFSSPAAQLVGAPGAYFIEGLSAGVSTLSLTTMDGQLSETVEITVTDPTAAVVPVALLVTLGAPEPK